MRFFPAILRTYSYGLRSGNKSTMTNVSINLLDIENKTVACVDYGYTLFFVDLSLERGRRICKGYNPWKKVFDRFFEIGFSRFEKLVY